MKIKTIVCAISLAISVVSTSGFAASSCSPEGRPTERVLVSQEPGQFALVWEPGGSGARRRTEAILGEFNASSGLKIGPGGFPAVAAYMGPEQRLGVALWFQGHKTLQLDGSLSKVAFSTSRDVGLFVAYVPKPRSEPKVEVQAVFSVDGRKLAERRIPFDPEAYATESFSTKGDVLFLRPAPAMSAMREVVLYDSGSFEKIAAFGLGGEVIHDVVVVDRGTAFFTARGGLFLFNKGRIESLGLPAAPMYHQQLDIDSTRGRVVSFGPGGYQIFSIAGESLAQKFHGERFNSIQGFAHDGSLIEGAVHGRTPYRLLNPLTSEVLAELPTERMHPANRAGERIDCASVDAIVLNNDIGPSTIVPLQRKH